MIAVVLVIVNAARLHWPCVCCAVYVALLVKLLHVHHRKTKLTPIFSAAVSATVFVCSV